MGVVMKIPTEFKAIDKFSSVVKSMTAGVTTFSKKSISAVQRFDTRVTRTFKKLGKISQMALGLGLAGIFALAIQGNIAFNDSLASVSAITGATGNDLIELEQLATATGKKTKMAGSEILKAYELVGSAKPELLKNASALDEVTRSVITLSKASRLDLETSALSLTAVMNQFNKTGKQSGEVIDVLAAGAKFGAAAIPQITESILQFGTGAKSFNVNMIESVALVETFAGKGIKGAEAGTKLRNILTKMSAIDALPKKAIDQLKKFGVNTDIVSDKTIPLSDRLKELSKVAGSSTALVKIFGLENKEAAGILLNNIPVFDQMTKSIAEKGVADTQAAANTNTLAFALGAIKTAFTNATTATNGNNNALEFVKNTLFFLGDNMETVVGIVGSLIGAYVLLKAITWGVQAATFAANVVMGINGVIQGKLTKKTAASTVALGAYKVAQGVGAAMTWIATAATTAFGIALNLGLWPILAIIAAIVAVVLVIKNWGKIVDWFGEKWKQFTGWISNLWANVVEWFTKFDFTAFFKGIGQSILTYMLFPMKMLLTLLSNIPGKIGKMASLGLEKIGQITGNIDVNADNPENTALDSPEKKQADVIRETTNSASIDLNIKDKGGNVESSKVTSNTNGIPIKIGSTQNAF